MKDFITFAHCHDMVSMELMLVSLQLIFPELYYLLQTERCLVACSFAMAFEESKNCLFVLAMMLIPYS